MKRAIFKIGQHCLISTRSEGDQYGVEISPEWVQDERAWDIPVHSATTPMNQDGTTIFVGELYPGIAQSFGEGAESFNIRLKRMISTHYAYIIDKGFEVTVNEVRVKPLTTKIIYDDRPNPGDDAVRPFVFRSNTDGVEVYLAVGFHTTDPITKRDYQRAGEHKIFVRGCRVDYSL